MNFLRSHIVLMTVYAVLAGAFFALLWKNERRDRIRTFLIVFSSLLIGGVALAWLMFPFPVK